MEKVTQKIIDKMFDPEYIFEVAKNAHQETYGDVRNWSDDKMKKFREDAANLIKDDKK